MPMLVMFGMWFVFGILSFKMYSKLVSSKYGTYVLDLKGLLMAGLVILLGLPSFLVVGAIYLQKVKPTINTD